MRKTVGGERELVNKKSEKAVKHSKFKNRYSLSQIT